jgi:hypothetical protein
VPCRCFIAAAAAAARTSTDQQQQRNRQRSSSSSGPNAQREFSRADEQPAPVLILRALRPDWPHAVPLLAAPERSNSGGRHPGTALVAAALRAHSYSLHLIVDSGASGTCAMTLRCSPSPAPATVKFNGAVSRAIGQGRCSIAAISRCRMACHAAQCALRPLEAHN